MCPIHHVSEDQVTADDAAYRGRYPHQDERPKGDGAAQPLLDLPCTRRRNHIQDHGCQLMDAPPRAVAGRETDRLPTRIRSRHHQLFTIGQMNVPLDR